MVSGRRFYARAIAMVVAVAEVVAIVILRCTDNASDNEKPETTVGGDIGPIVRRSRRHDEGPKPPSWCNVVHYPE